MVVDADALYRQALAACEQGCIDDGIRLAQRALAMAPNETRIHKLLGMALLRVGRNDDALASFDRALVLGSATADVFGSRADALVALGRFDAAVESYDCALALKPDSIEDWCNRGAVLLDLKRFNDSVASFDRALALAPGFAAAHYNRGNALAALGRYGDALVSYDRAIELAPDYADAHNNRANALDRLGRLTDALASVERALAVDSGHRPAMITRAIVLRKLGHSADALAACDCALALVPDDPDALTVRGDILIDLERFDEAIAVFDRVIGCDPSAPAAVTARWNKSFVCLGLGRLEEGWALYDNRWISAIGLVPRPYPQPRWTGGAVDGTLLVWGEQGLGDEIIHSGMLPDVVDRVARVAVEVEPRLVPLFSRSFPGVTVIGMQGELAPGPFAAQVPIGSLGQLFRNSWQSFPKRRRGYLLADASRSESLRARLANDGCRVIGLSWVSKAPIGGAQKSARLADFAALFQLPGCRFVDLQYGDTGAERVELERVHGVRVERLDDIDNTNDLDGLAALICACDAVVTVSNTTAHLAGALGRPTWVMVPSGQARIWYWFRDRNDSPWYPRVQVRRQLRGQPWSDLIRGVAHDLSRVSR